MNRRLSSMEVPGPLGNRSRKDLSKVPGPLGKKSRKELALGSGGVMKKVKSVVKFPEGLNKIKKIG